MGGGGGAAGIPRGFNVGKKSDMRELECQCVYTGGIFDVHDMLFVGE